MGRRVTRTADLEPPGLGRAFLRTAVLFATSLTVVDTVLLVLMSHFQFNQAEQALLAVGQLVGYLIMFGIRMSTMRARNGYRGLHEMLSGTRTVQLPAVQRRGVFVPVSRKGEPASDSRAAGSLRPALALPPGLPAQIACHHRKRGHAVR